MAKREICLLLTCLTSMFQCLAFFSSPSQCSDYFYENDASRDGNNAVKGLTGKLLLSETFIGHVTLLMIGDFLTIVVSIIVLCLKISFLCG